MKHLNKIRRTLETPVNNFIYMASIFKQIARHIVFPAVYATGLQHLLSAFSPHDKLVLCYHGVDISSSLPYNGRHISRENFERHLIYFKRHFNTVSFSEMFELYQEDATPDRPTLALTFDDGYLNNYQHALPLLEQYEIPATFFISTFALEKNGAIVWQDVIDILRESKKEKGLQVAGLDFRPRNGDLFHLYERQSGQKLIEYIDKLENEARIRLIDEIKTQYSFEDIVRKGQINYWKLMTKPQLQALSASPWAEVGSHSHQHLKLDEIAPELARRELAYAKQLLTETIQKEVSGLAFPNGRYNQEVKDMSKALGYRHLAAINYLLAEDKNDPDILPRENVSGTTNYYSQIIHIHQQIPKVGI